MISTAPCPRLEFSMDLPVSAASHLVNGHLIIKKERGLAGIKLKATSGCRGSQFFRSWMLKGRGPLPPTGVIFPLTWTVSTQRLWLPNVKGVEGSFYAISPFQVVLPGVTRGDFGVHFDANVPGSAGCCVIQSQEHWDLFRECMEQFRLMKLQQIPLSVSYS